MYISNIKRKKYLMMGEIKIPKFRKELAVKSVNHGKSQHFEKRASPNKQQSDEMQNIVRWRSVLIHLPEILKE